MASAVAGFFMALFIQIGLTVFLVLALMFVFNENSPIPLTLWYGVSLPPLLFTVTLFAVLHHRSKALSEGILLGAIIAAIPTLIFLWRNA